MLPGFSDRYQDWEKLLATLIKNPRSPREGQEIGLVRVSRKTVWHMYSANDALVGKSKHCAFLTFEVHRINTEFDTIHDPATSM